MPLSPETGSSGDRDASAQSVTIGKPCLEKRFITTDSDATTALAAAASLLAPAPVRGGGGLVFGVGGMGMRSALPIQAGDRLVVNVRAADRRDGVEVDGSLAPFPALTLEQAQACADEPGQVLLEVASTGVITRCEGQNPEHRCACGQLQKVAPAAWLAGRRWSVNVSVDRKDELTSDGKLVLSGYWNTRLTRVALPDQKYPRFKPKVEDPSIEAWTPGADQPGSPSKRALRHSSRRSRPASCAFWQPRRRPAPAAQACGRWRT
jgi:hypothetical protein